MKKQSAHFDKFTERVKEALVLAQSEAERRGQCVIEPEHLVLGLLHQPQATAGWLVSELGVAPEMLAHALKARLSVRPKEQRAAEASAPLFTEERMAVSTVLPAVGGGQVILEDARPLGNAQLSARSRQAITYAVAEFAALRHPVLATGHVLLGILREKQGGALFSSWGISLKTARTQMKRVSQQALLDEQQGLALFASEANTPGIPIALTGQVSGAVSIDAIARQKLSEQNHSVRKAMWIYYLGFALLVCAALAFILQSSQWLAAYRLFIARLSASPGLSWQPIVDWHPLLTLLAYLVVSSALMLVALPLHWYISIVLPRRNGLSRRTTRQWLSTLLNKTFWLVSLVVGGMVELVTWLMVIQPRTWWAWAALAPTLFFVIMGLFGSSRFAFWARDITPIAEGPIFERFQTLRTRLGLPTCRLYRFQVSHRSRAANAFFAGWGPGRRVVITDTLLQQFSPDEIEAIIAHELGHCAHRDMWTNFLMSGLVSLGIFGVIALYLNTLSALATSSSLSALLQPLYFVLGVLGLLALLRLNVAYRRYKEERADEYALRATGNVQAFKDGMTKLTHMSLSRRHSNSATAITHPALLKRLRHADDFARRQGSYS